MSSPSELAFEVPFPLTMSLPLRTAIYLPSVAFGLQTSDSLAPEIHPTARPKSLRGKSPAIYYYDSLANISNEYR